MSEEEISSLSEDEIRELMEEGDEISDIQSIMESIYSEFPPEPPIQEDKMLYYLFYAAQYSIFYFLKDGKLSPPQSTDSIAELREKAIGIQFYSIWNRFCEQIDIYGEDLLIKITEGIKKRKPKHPLLTYLDELCQHKELHSRRIKGNPALQRTRQEIQRVSDPAIPAKNLITDEAYDAKNPRHDHWKWLIINPLPSDYDENILDPAEGDVTYRMNHMVEELNGHSKLKNPYCVIVTNEFDKLLRLLHFVLHFEAYLNNYMIGAISTAQIEVVEKMSSWSEIWNYLLGDEYHDKSIQKMSREKKTNPLLVSRLAELRDLLRTVMDLTKK
jgi:hypothetical protein